MQVTLRETNEKVNTRTLEDCGTRGTWNEILDIPYSDKPLPGVDAPTPAVTPVRATAVLRVLNATACAHDDHGVAVDHAPDALLPDVGR